MLHFWNAAEALQIFKQSIMYYCEDEEVTEPRKIPSKILRGIGNKGLKRLNAFSLKADKKNCGNSKYKSRQTSFSEYISLNWWYVDSSMMRQLMNLLQGPKQLQTNVWRKRA